MLKYDKVKPIRDPAYLEHIRTKPTVTIMYHLKLSLRQYIQIVRTCKITYNNTVHHAGRRYVALKCSDHEVVPLTPEEHNELDNIGQKEFERKYNLNLREIAKALYELYKGENNGTH
jgi:hypothetical protein